MQTDLQPVQREMRELVIPIPDVPWPVLRVQVPMSSEAWDHIMRMLDVMKPALVAPDADMTDAEQEREVADVHRS